MRRNSRDPDLWQYNDDLKQPVSEMLAATYGISGERVSQQLADVAGKLVADYWDNNSEDISAIVDGSLLMDYDDAGVEMPEKRTTSHSIEVLSTPSEGLKALMTLTKQCKSTCCRILLLMALFV